MEQLRQAMVKLRHKDAHAASRVQLWHAQRRPSGAKLCGQLLEICLHLRRVGVRHAHAAPCVEARLFAGPPHGVVGEHSPAVELSGAGRRLVVNLCARRAVRARAFSRTQAHASAPMCMSHDSSLPAFRAVSSVIRESTPRRSGQRNECKARNLRRFGGGSNAQTLLTR